MGNMANLHMDDSEDCLDRVVVAQDVQPEHQLSKSRNLRVSIAGLSIVFTQILRILTEHVQDPAHTRALIPTVTGSHWEPRHPHFLRSEISS